MRLLLHVTILSASRAYSIAALLFVAGISLMLSGCLGLSAGSENASTSTPFHTPTRSASATSTSVPTATATQTSAPTSTLTPTASQTATQTATATNTLTPTPDVPFVTSLMQAFCRYGPGKAYLYAHGLYEGDRGALDGKNYSGSWLWIQPENLDWHCWVSASVVDFNADLAHVPVVQTRLPQSTLYGPPEEVAAQRNGDRVRVAWEKVWMTEDDFRGYLIEANVCQNGYLVSIAVQTDYPEYEFTDEPGCDAASSGLLYTVEKHGYTTPIKIPWP